MKLQYWQDGPTTFICTTKGHIFVIFCIWFCVSPGPNGMRDKPAHQSEVCFCRCSTAEGIKVIWEKPGDLELRHSVTHRLGKSTDTRRVFSQLLLWLDQWIWLMSPPRRCRNENIVCCLVQGANHRVNVYYKCKEKNSIRWGTDNLGNGIPAPYARAPSSQDVFRLQRDAQSKQSERDFSFSPRGKTFGLVVILGVSTSWRGWSPAVMKGIVHFEPSSGPTTRKKDVAKTFHLCRLCRLKQN